MTAPYYDDGTVTIFHGDWRDLAPEADVVITDPPYGAGFYETDTEFDCARLEGWSDSRLAVFGYPEQLIHWIITAGVPAPSEWVAWWPTNGHIFGNPRLLPRESEHIALWGDLPGAKRLRRPRSDAEFARAEALTRGKDVDTTRLGDVWRDAAPGKGFNRHERLHPNQKPVSLMMKLVQLCSERGELILDPYMGSGSTLVAAKSLGRRAIGFELNERWCEVAASRLGQEVLDVAA